MIIPDQFSNMTDDNDDDDDDIAFQTDVAFHVTFRFYVINTLHRPIMISNLKQNSRRE